MSRLPASFSASIPVLEHFPEIDGAVARIPLVPLPFRIGRNSDAHYVIHSRQVSKDHAEIAAVNDGFVIRDLRSTNGTFVNGKAVTEVLLNSGDIIHIAHKEFRFSFSPRELEGSSEDPLLTDPVRGGVPLSLIHGSEALREVIRNHQVRVLFQPIVRLETEETVAFEALGRGAHHDLSPNPADLFRLAEKCKLASDLSRLFRFAAVEEAARIPGHIGFFFNLHPSEMEDLTLVSSLSETAAAFRQAGRRMVLEIHEDFVTNTATMKQLRERLREMSIGLAYDDFGAGQDRLTLLAEVPPDFVKLDMKLIRGLDKAPARQEIVWTLGHLAARLGVPMIAEGLETREEAEVCRRLGCAFGQGYLFGRPSPAASFCRATDKATRKIDLSAVYQRFRERASGGRPAIMD